MSFASWEEALGALKQLPAGSKERAEACAKVQSSAYWPVQNSASRRARASSSLDRPFFSLCLTPPLRTTLRSPRGRGTADSLGE